MQHLFWNISCNIELQNSGRVNFYPSACQQEIVICLHLKLHSSAIWYVTDLTFTCYCMTANCCNQSFHIQKWLLVMSNLEITRSWRNFENKKYSSEPTTCSYEIIGKTKHLEPWSFPMSSSWRSSRASVVARLVESLHLLLVSLRKFSPLQSSLSFL